MSVALDQEFETGVRLIRDAYGKKLSQKEAEVVHLRGENARKDGEIKELKNRIEHLEIQLARSEKRSTELSKYVSKLHHFKQSILNSFENDELGELKKKAFHPPATPTFANNSVLEEKYSLPKPVPQKSMYMPSVSADYSKGSILGNLDDLIPPSTKNSFFEPGLFNLLTKEPKYPPIIKENSKPNDSFGSTIPIIADKTQSDDRKEENLNSQQKQKDNTVDGRDYFRKAKSILSYDDFTNLLWNVKAYNNREQSRSKTLENVYQQIGLKQKDLFEEFERLLNR